MKRKLFEEDVFGDLSSGNILSILNKMKVFIYTGNFSKVGKHIIL
jgi:hypothetical protein